MAEHRVEYVEVAGTSIPAERLVCPGCHRVDLTMEFDVSEEPWTAYCPCGTSFPVNTRPNA